MTPPLKVISIIFFLTISFRLFAQTNKKTQPDTSIYSSQNLTIQGIKFNGFLTTSGFQLVNSKNEPYLKHPGDYFTWEFKDFNKDGYKDIYLNKGGNTPERFDLLLYVSSIKSFREIKDFEYYPAPEKIAGTKYYYSYHKSGCADMNWDSDLFCIKEYKAIRVANISGRECEDSGIKDGLYINRFRANKKILIKALSIDTVHTFKEDKWGFIKEYWNKNYKFFL